MTSGNIRDPSVYFDSFHQLMTYQSSSTTNPIYRYADCAYIEIRSSPTTFFDPAFHHGSTLTSTFRIRQDFPSALAITKSATKFKQQNRRTMQWGILRRLRTCWHLHFQLQPIRMGSIKLDLSIRWQLCRTSLRLGIQRCKSKRSSITMHLDAWMVH